MVHLRIIAPPECVAPALDLLGGSDSVQNLVHLAGAAHKPPGDVILCDVAREDASVILDDLRRLEIPIEGSIALEAVDTSISQVARKAERAAPGLPSDAVVWEDVEARTRELTELSFSFVAFMSLSMLLAAVAILVDQPILLIGAMVVGPEFGPIAGVYVAAIRRRADLARRSLGAIAAGFAIAIVLTLAGVLALRLTGIGPADFGASSHPLTGFVSNPDETSFIVAFLAGIAGALSLTTAKSGALVGVLISVTTIPAAANIGVGTAYGAGDELAGAAAQLGLNLAALLLAGILTLYVQRLLYVRRREHHQRELGGEAPGAAAAAATAQDDPAPTTS